MKNEKELFLQYREITLEIEKLLEEDKIEELEYALEERQKVLDKMIDVDRVQGGKWIKELEIQELHEKVYSLMEEKKVSIKNEIRRLNQGKRVSCVYSNDGEKGIYFSQKI
ncbi:hypothetical protein [Clostridium sp. UBA1056]|uniref:hypothetical protein n=1 Tax=unclassified Clostridium TaxID=2614128 RepID=UPI00321697E7